MRLGLLAVPLLALCLALGTFTGCPDDPVAPTADTGVDGGDAQNDTDGGGETDAPVGTPCNCGPRQCGISPPGDPVGCEQVSCGECTGVGESCTPQGLCEVKGDVLGAWCGTTEACPGLVPDPADPTGQKINPNLELCLNAQCLSEICLTAPAGGKFVTNMPACSMACTIKKDDNNDGVEDDDVATDCVGFSPNGPAGDTDWSCVQFSLPGQLPTVAYCMPKASFTPCAKDSDCPGDEACTFIDVQGNPTPRCQKKLLPGEWGTVKNNGERCTEDGGETGDAEYCASGWCLATCADYCDQDADCNDAPAGSCVGGMCSNYPDRSCTVDDDCTSSVCFTTGLELFSPLSGVAPQPLCIPVECDTDANCVAGTYCDIFSWELEDDMTSLRLITRCEPQGEGTGALGERCDDTMPCANEDLCLEGYCSAYCQGDGDCAAEQLCVVNPNIVLVPAEVTGEPPTIQSAPGKRCESFPGDGPSCRGQGTCDDYEKTPEAGGLEHRCSVYARDNAGDPDAPVLVEGKCIPSVGNQVVGTLCSEDIQCASGVCLGDICSLTCATSDDCPNPTDGMGNEFVGYCRSAAVAFGGDFNNDATTAFAGLCFFSEASGEDCSSGYTCSDEAEACAPIVLVGDPTELPSVEYLCLNNTNPDGSVGTKEAGETCDREATNAQGQPLVECKSGLCLFDANTQDGVCSQLCNVDIDCPGSLVCTDRVVYERQGAYAANTGLFRSCMPPGN